MFKNSINKVFLLGRLGSDPILKYTSNNVPVININIATNETYKDKDNNYKTRTEWHKLVFYNNLAESIANFTQKGSLIFIEGTLKTRKFIVDDNNTKNITEIIVSNLQIINTKDRKFNTTDLPNENINKNEDDDLTNFDEKAPF